VKEAFLKAGLSEEEAEKLAARALPSQDLALPTFEIEKRYLRHL
jgi:hypothetical protein